MPAGLPATSPGAGGGTQVLPEPQALGTAYIHPPNEPVSFTDRKLKPGDLKQCVCCHPAQGAAGFTPAASGSGAQALPWSRALRPRLLQPGSLRLSRQMPSAPCCCVRCSAQGREETEVQAEDTHSREEQPAGWGVVLRAPSSEQARGQDTGQ